MYACHKPWQGIQHVQQHQVGTSSQTTGKQSLSGNVASLALLQVGEEAEYPLSTYNIVSYNTIQYNLRTETDNLPPPH